METPLATLEPTAPIPAHSALDHVRTVRQSAPDARNLTYTTRGVKAAGEHSV